MGVEVDKEIQLEAPRTDARAALYPGGADDAKPVRSEAFAQGVQFVVGAVGGGAVAALTIASMGSDSIPRLLAAFALCIVLLWLQILVHEAGHALAGIATGRRLIGAGIGPLRLERATGGWRMRWGGGVRGIGGFAALLPMNGRGGSRRDEAVFLLGGPVANLLAAAVALVALWLAPPAGAAFAALAATALFGALLGVVNLVPFRSQGWRSDGYGLRELLRDSAESRIGRIQQRVVSLSLAGVRPRDWPIEELGDAGDMPHDQAVSAHVLRLSWALDRGDGPAADAAAHALAAAYPTLADGRRQGVALMLATYAVQSAHDPALLAAWRPLCEGGLLDMSAHRLWLDGEAAALRDDTTAARTLSAKARSALGRVHDVASVTVLRERLDALDARLTVEA